MGFPLLPCVIVNPMFWLFVVYTGDEAPNTRIIAPYIKWTTFSSAMTRPTSRRERRGKHAFRGRPGRETRG